MSNYPNPEEGNRNWKFLVKMEEGIPVKVDNKPFNWKTDSGDRPTDEYLAWSGYYEYVNEVVEFDSKTHKLIEYSLKDSIVDHAAKRVTAKKEIVPLTAEEVLEKKKEAFEKLRAWRNDKLAATDWTQLPDHEETFRNTWADFRQQLRDIPNNLAVEDVYDFVFPEPPSLGPEFQNEMIDWGTANTMFADN